MSSTNLTNGVSASKDKETERIENLFKKLDSDGDGIINFKDLTNSLKKYNLPTQDAEVHLNIYVEKLSML